MMPLLESGDQVLVLRNRLWSFVRRGDVILLKLWPETASDSGEFLIKRVVGLPGDTLFMYNLELSNLKGVVDNASYAYFSSIVSPNTNVTYVINGDDKLKREFLSMAEKVEVVKVPPNHFFVKGDWLLGGDDSITRGPVPSNMLVGSVVTKLS